MPAQQPINIVSAILCDDIRQETNGKLLAIGIYSSDILVPDFPSRLSFALLVIGSIKSSGDTLIEFKHEYQNDGESSPSIEAQSGGQLRVEAKSEAAEVYIPTPKIPLEFMAPGRLTVKGRINGGRWKTLFTKSVNKAKVPGLSQPSSSE